mmetsp:Transcript_66404/g.130201  ORF Transcript_66404/g.130201 Transcript_66404/m.130201 type:complete len:612 (-) Transcript_66404:188-2023(-)
MQSNHYVERPQWPDDPRDNANRKRALPSPNMVPFPKDFKAQNKSCSAVVSGDEPQAPPHHLNESANRWHANDAYTHLVPDHHLAQFNLPSRARNFVSAGVPPVMQHYHAQGAVRPSTSDMSVQQHQLAMFMEAQSKEEEKKKMKRAANRKSAYTSRARKKQFVEEMTVANRDLKLHAHILDLIPDLILGLDQHGVVTYVSSSVSRQLQYPTDSILGTSIYNLVTPGSSRTVTAVLERRGFRAPLAAQQALDTLATNGFHQHADQVRSGDQSRSQDEGSSELRASDGTECRPESALGSTSSGTTAPATLPGNSSSTGTCANEAMSTSSGDDTSVGVVSSRETLSTKSSSITAENVSASNTSSDGDRPSSNDQGSGNSSSDGGNISSGEDEDGKAPGSEGQGEDGAMSSAGESGGGFAAWSHVNLKRHNEEQNERGGVSSLCLIRCDRTTLWCEASSNIREPVQPEEGESADGTDAGTDEGGGERADSVEVIFSLRPLRDGQPMPASFPALAERHLKMPPAPLASKKAPSSSTVSKSSSSTMGSTSSASLSTSPSASSLRDSSAPSSRKRPAKHPSADPVGAISPSKLPVATITTPNTELSAAETLLGLMGGN